MKFWHKFRLAILKFRFFTRIQFLPQFRFFLSEFRFLTKISIFFYQNFFSKIVNFSIRISIFDQNFNFLPEFHFWPKFRFLTQFDFWSGGFQPKLGSNPRLALNFNVPIKVGRTSYNLHKFSGLCDLTGLILIIWLADKLNLIDKPTVKSRRAANLFNIFINMRSIMIVKHWWQDRGIHAKTVHLTPGRSINTKKVSTNAQF